MQGVKIQKLQQGECMQRAFKAYDILIQTLRGTPTPDDLDSLITKVWKTPAFFLTNPLGVAAFGREATRRGVPPVQACRQDGQILRLSEAVRGWL